MDSVARQEKKKKNVHAVTLLYSNVFHSKESHSVLQSENVIVYRLIELFEISVRSHFNWKGQIH